MKKSLFALLAAVVVASLPMWAAKTITASKNYVTRTVNTGSFTGVHTTSSIDIEYRQGPLKVQLYAPDNLVPYIKVKVSNNALTAYYDYNGSITIIGNNNTKLIVSAPNVTSFCTQASGDIDIKTGYVTNGKVSFTTQGSGDIEALSVKAGEVKLTTQASGDIELSTIEASIAQLATQGSGDIDVSSVKASTVSVMSQASGDIEIKTVTGTSAKVMTQGSGDVDVAQLSVTGLEATVQGSGDMSLKGKCVNAAYSSYSSGSIYAKSMNAEVVTARTYGSGDIDCYASKSVIGDTYGSGDISVSGHPGQKKISDHR